MCFHKVHTQLTSKRTQLQPSVFTSFNDPTQTPKCTRTPLRPNVYTRYSHRPSTLFSVPLQYTSSVHPACIRRTVHKDATTISPSLIIVVWAQPQSHMDYACCFLCSPGSYLPGFTRVSVQRDTEGCLPRSYYTTTWTQTIITQLS